MPIDYSKWKTIEVSDDEDDTHPNIDTPSLFRWRHQARLERMAERKQEKEQLEANKKTLSDKVQNEGQVKIQKFFKRPRLIYANLSELGEIQSKLNSSSIDEKERIKLELEKKRIKEQEDEFLRKERELEEKERLQPWNVDTIGHEVWSKSIINKPSEQKTEEQKEDEDEAYKKLLKYFDDNESQLKELGMLEGFQKVENYLLDRPHLCSEYATNFLTIEALNHAIERQYAKMDRVAENCITIQYLLELAKTLKAVASNTNVIKNFFKKIAKADPSYMKMYHDEVDAFRERLRKRAQEKREAAINEYDAEEKAKRIAQSPGGLDPQEVLDSLPEAMQEAFQTQSMEKMYEVAETMDPEVFQHHMQRCIDSGLWIPNAKEAAEKEAAAKVAAEKTEANNGDKKTGET